MYFEDIFEKVAPLWKREFSLEGIEETETYINDIRNNWNQSDDELSRKSYSWWEFSLLYSMYKTLTRFGIKKWTKEKAKTLKFDEIPISLFEKTFRDSFEPEDEYEGNLEYLKQYKGFRNPPN